jgi:hypothetical protein
MDERTKSIHAVEQKIAGETARLNGFLRGLGRLLLERSQDGMIAAERSAYERINDETTRLDAAIQQIDRDVEQVNEINNKMADAKQLNKDAQGQLVVLFPNLGKRVTEDERLSMFAAPYKTRIDGAQQKIDDLNERLAVINEKGPANVFARLGRGAQRLALKSALAKTEAARDRAYAEAGAEFLRNEPVDGQPGCAELDTLYTAAVSLKNEHDERDIRIISLEEEKRKILAAFGHDGNANRKKTEIRYQAEQLGRELNDLYLRLGRKAADPFTRLMFESLLDDEMRRILEDAEHCRETVKDYEEQTAKLKISLEIDEERADVEKLTKLIAIQRQRIAAAEEIIAQHDKHIAEANKRIADLLRG